MLSNYVKNHVRRAATRSIQKASWAGATSTKMAVPPPVPYSSSYHGYSTVSTRSSLGPLNQTNNHPFVATSDVLFFQHNFSAKKNTTNTILYTIQRHSFSTRATAREGIQQATSLLNDTGKTRAFGALTPDVVNLIRAEFEVS